MGKQSCKGTQTNAWRHRGEGVSADGSPSRSLFTSPAPIRTCMDPRCAHRGDNMAQKYPPPDWAHPTSLRPEGRQSPRPAWLPSQGVQGKLCVRFPLTTLISLPSFKMPNAATHPGGSNFVSYPECQHRNSLQTPLTDRLLSASIHWHARKKMISCLQTGKVQIICLPLCTVLYFPIFLHEYE